MHDAFIVVVCMWHALLHTEYGQNLTSLSFCWATSMAAGLRMRKLFSPVTLSKSAILCRHISSSEEGNFRHHQGLAKILQ